jgi:hypothetical protein
MRHRKVCLLASAIALSICSGCAHFQKKRMVAMEPPLAGGTVVGDPVIDGGARPVTFVDRHPLLSKPRDVYHNTNHHKVVRVAAATVVGVPVGVVCETGQIIKGCPPGM